MRKKFFLQLLVLVLVNAVATTTSSAKTIYVDADAAGAGNGSNWANAYNCLQDALSAARPGDEIRVGQGVYKPDQGGSNVPGNREATFQLIDDVKLYGGYAGLGQPDPDARDIVAYQTILSGDLSGNDVEVDNPTDLRMEPTRLENSYHIVTGSGTNETAVLDGFVITAGCANEYPFEVRGAGAGVYVDSGSPIISNCTVSLNRAFACGGGMFNNESSPTVKDCTFTNNWADMGAGMTNFYSSTVITHCTFSKNWGDHYGGGISNLLDSSAMLTDCIFAGNRSDHSGGGMYNEQSSTTLINCTFSGNRTSTGSQDGTGGGIASRSNSSLTVVNCTFNDNIAPLGAGIYNQSSATVTNCAFNNNTNWYLGTGASGIYNWGSATITNCTLTNNKYAGIINYSGLLSVTNCTFSNNWVGILDIAGPSNVTNGVFWNNQNVGIEWSGSMPEVTYSNVQSGWPGAGNINADPMFVDAANGDYHLLPDSPCIDAGNNAALPSDTTDLDGDGDIEESIPLDLDGNPRIVGVAVDMGAYEFLVPIIEVAVDIKPGSYPNAINLGSYGLIPVAILSSEQFNASTVNPDTVELGGAGVEVRGKSNKFMAHEEDVNGDGLVDLVLQVASQNLDPGAFQDGYGMLTGITYDGKAIQGKDEVIIVPSKQ